MTLAVYVQVLGFEFIDLDDDQYILNNPHIRDGLTWEGIRWAFTADLTAQSPYVDYWQPLTLVSRMLDIEFFGFNPAGHHWTSLMIFTLNSVLLFLVLQRMTANPWPSAFVAAIFAIHPLRVESVAWVAERKDVLSAFFWVLTMWAYLRYARRPGLQRYLAVMAAMALGLMCKPMAVTMPIVLLLLDYWPLQRIDGSNFRSKILIEKLPFVALSAASCAVAFLGEHPPMKDSTLLTQTLNAPVCYAWYIWKMFWPADLAIWYPRHVGVFFPAWKIAGAILLMMGITYGVMRYRAGRKYLVFGWLWFIVTLLPVTIGGSNIDVADHFTYVPHVGLSVMLAWGIGEMSERRSWSKRSLSMSAAAVLTALALGAWVQTRLWRQSVTIFEQGLRVTEGNYLLQHKMGVQFLKRQNRDRAKRHFLKALRIHSSFAGGHNNLGIVLLSEGNVEEAISHFRRAIELDPGLSVAHANLETAQSRAGRPDESIDLQSVIF